MFAQTVSTYFSNSGIRVTDDMVFDTAGNLYGSDFNGNKVYKITPQGFATTFVSGLANPNGLAFDSNGNLFVVEYSGGRIHKYNSNGVLLQSFFVGAFPSGLIKDFDSDDMIFTLTQASSVNRLSTSNGSVTTLASGFPLNTPVGLTFDDNGNLYSGNFVGRQIYKITTSSPQLIATVPNGGTNSNLAFITYANGFLWGTVYLTGHKIYKINPNAVDDVTLFAGNNQGSNDGSVFSASFDSPSGIIFNPSQNALYVSEFTTSGNIRKINNIPLSINDINASETILTISPNPSKRKINIYSTSQQLISSNTYNISLFDITGKVIYNAIHENNNNNFSITIDISKYDSGVYFVNVITDEGFKITKSIIKY
jgi:sugar lactone lactonase YvrE